MVELLSANTDSIRGFLAILAHYLPRTIIFVVFMPLLSKGAATALVKSAIAISIVLLPVQAAYTGTFVPVQQSGSLFFNFLTEIMVGSLLGLTMALPYYIFMAVGAVIDVSRGATFSAQVNGQDSGEQLPLETLFGLLFATLILAGPGLHAVTVHLLHSYIVFPPGMIEASQFNSWALALVKLVVDHMVFAILLSAPVLIIILLVEFAMDILASFTQQMQVYSLQFGMRSVFGIGALILLLEFAEDEIFNVFHDYSSTLYNLMGVAL